MPPIAKPAIAPAMLPVRAEPASAPAIAPAAVLRSDSDALDIQAARARHSAAAARILDDPLIFIVLSPGSQKKPRLIAGGKQGRDGAMLLSLLEHRLCQHQ